MKIVNRKKCFAKTGFIFWQYVSPTRDIGSLLHSLYLPESPEESGLANKTKQQTIWTMTNNTPIHKSIEDARRFLFIFLCIGVLSVIHYVHMMPIVSSLPIFLLQIKRERTIKARFVRWWLPSFVSTCRRYSSVHPTWSAVRWLNKDLTLLK